MGLVCASCSAENASGARFCSECGAALLRSCPACGFEQPAGATFCSNCGVALREDARRAAEATDERQERRVVTVLFADLAGSTALGEQLEPEDVRQLQGELFELINAEVERFGRPWPCERASFPSPSACTAATVPTSGSGSESTRVRWSRAAKPQPAAS